ncbi:hypothetical protein EV127DRAFT_67072 [Xylaria flabelliformis]|nr:hypothetical protein EV127DRAFT_67072 [Xylaria flabelliformis]
MSDAYLRTGRGGAGNFYSHKDVEEAVAKDKTEDIEAQKAPLPIDDNSTAPASTPGTSAPIRSGRGGAGNFIPSTLPSTNTTSFPPTSTGTPKSPSAASKYSGRGGAGNWTATAAESEGAKRAKEEQEQRRKEALDAGLAQEIRASLPQQPARTYHLHAPGRGRKPEAGEGGRVDV